MVRAIIEYDNTQIASMNMNVLSSLGVSIMGVDSVHPFVYVDIDREQAMSLEERPEIKKVWLDEPIEVM